MNSSYQLKGASGVLGLLLVVMPSAAVEANIFDGTTLEDSIIDPSGWGDGSYSDEIVDGRTRTTPLFDAWRRLGGERSFFGRPVNGVPGTAERLTPDKVGRYVHFERGSIYQSPNTGAHEVHGAIRDKWASLGWERSFLRYPLSDELSTPDGIGRFNKFQGGSIYWTQQTGAHEVHGDILAKWANLGWERSFLGYPVSDERNTADGRGRISNFQRGYIDWYPGRGAIVHGIQK